MADESALSKEPDVDNEVAFGALLAQRPVSTPRRPVERERRESLIAPDLVIEGTIQGAGHVRIAGCLKGDVRVEGDVTIEVGAQVDGSVRARLVVIAGALEGNIESASRVELLETGAIVGDIKAASVVVAAGAKSRGQIEFGWDGVDAGVSPS
jgi:cytoskeletal protein CcmA (bactofilin family)